MPITEEEIQVLGKNYEHFISQNPRGYYQKRKGMIEWAKTGPISPKEKKFIRDYLIPEALIPEKFAALKIEEMIKKEKVR